MSRLSPVGRTEEELNEGSSEEEEQAGMMAEGLGVDEELEEGACAVPVRPGTACRERLAVIRPAPAPSVGRRG